MRVLEHLLTSFIGNVRIHWGRSPLIGRGLEESGSPSTPWGEGQTMLGGHHRAVVPVREEAWYQDIPGGALSFCTVARSKWISMPPQDSQLHRLVRKARHAPSRIGRVPGNLGRFVRALAIHPIETLQYIPESVSQHLFDKQVAYDVEEDYGAPFHQMLGVPWPCGEIERFQQIWADIESSLLANGLSFGRWTYGEYSDADPALGAATWCAVRHQRPTTVLETGVARGVTSRIILEALSLNGTGHLWSLDLPHPFRPELHKETAAAVPTSCRDRWTYIRGSSRSQLPSLVSRLKNIDMFVHNSLHIPVAICDLN